MELTQVEREGQMTAVKQDRRSGSRLDTQVDDDRGADRYHAQRNGLAA